MAARTEDGRLTVVYVPAGPSVVLKAGVLDAAADSVWFEPVLGGNTPATARPEAGTVHFDVPDAGDWVLVCRQ
jgi:hypothetical protein